MPAVVLLHGFTHTGASWEPVRRALDEQAQRQRYRAGGSGLRGAGAAVLDVVAPDLRGHGSAADRRPVSLSAVLDDLARQAPARFTLAGYSMGGRIALHAALAMPDRVRRLVLIGASPGLASREEREVRVAADERLAEELDALAAAGRGVDEFARSWATSTPVLAGQPASVREAAERDRLRNTPAGLAAALRGLGTGALPSLWDRLEELAMPVALVVGERDARFGAVAEEMVLGLRDGAVVMVPEAGHAVHLEAPGAVAAVIQGGGEES